MVNRLRPHHLTAAICPKSITSAIPAFSREPTPAIHLDGNGIRRIDKDFREFFDRLRVLRRGRDGRMEPLLMAMATGYDYRKYQKVKANERRQA